MPEQINKVSHCKNCQAALSESFSYCPNCSQKVDEEQNSLKGLLSHFLTDYFTFDSKIIKSLWPLVSSPGTLTQEFVNGRRVRYIPPLRMYIFVSLFFFLLLSWNNGFTSEIENSQVAELDNYFGSLLPKIFFVMLPVFSLFLALLFRKKKVSIVYHVVFGLHYHAFVFLAMLMYLLVSQISTWLSFQHYNWILFSVFALGFLVYLYVAIKKVYQLNHKATSIRFLALLLLYFIVLATLSLVVLAIGTLT